MKDLELEFIPCDLHLDTPAIKMELSDKGTPVFKCLDCVESTYSTNGHTVSSVS